MAMCWITTASYLLLIVTSLVNASPSRTKDPSLAAPYLNQAAQRKGKLFFGTATDIPGVEQQNVEYMRILNDTKIWGQLTATNYMKVPPTIQTSRNR